MSHNLCEVDMQIIIIAFAFSSLDINHDWKLKAFHKFTILAKCSSNYFSVLSKKSEKSSLLSLNLLKPSIYFIQFKANFQV